MKKLLLCFLIVVVTVCSLVPLYACNENNYGGGTDSISDTEKESTDEFESENQESQSSSGGGLTNGGTFQGH